TAPLIKTFSTDLLNRSYAERRYRLSKNKLSRSMAKKVLASLKGIIKEAEAAGQIAKNPARAVSIKVPKRGTRKIKSGRDFPSKPEINLLLEKASGRWRPLIIVAVFTGMRSSELRGLRWADVDFHKKVVHVHQRADAWGAMGAPKSEEGERTIPMAPIVASALKEWKLRCPRKEKGNDDPGALELVFPNGAGNPESHANIANRCFYPLQVESGVTVAGDAKYGFHTLRHFFASWLIEQGFTPKKLQGMLGHSTTQMTFDTYGHLFPDDEADQAKFAAGEAALL